MDNQPASAPPSPANNNTQSSGSPAGNRKKYLLYLGIGAVVLVIVSAVAFALVRLVQQKQQLQQKQPGQASTGDPTKTPILNDQQITIPISVEDPQTTSVGFVYKYNTRLKEIGHEGSRVKLITDTKNPNPWFIISPDTEIFFRDASGKFRPAKTEDLKPGQSIEIFVAYGLQSKRWLTQRVFILESNNGTDDF